MNNSLCGAHMYILTHFFPLYVVSKIGLSTIAEFLNAHLFSNVVIMTLNYVLYPILMQISKKYLFWRFISIHPASTHSNEQHRHVTTLPLISSSDHLKTGLYQGSADRCEGDRNFDLICLLQKSQAIHYCDQSMLAIVRDLNIFVFSITIVYLILRSAKLRL